MIFPSGQSPSGNIPPIPPRSGSINDNNFTPLNHRDCSDFVMYIINELKINDLGSVTPVF